MSVSTTPGGRRVALYVRSLVPAGSREQQTAVLERLSALESAGAIEGYDVHVWGKRAPASQGEARTEAGEYAAERISRFREWAAANDVSVDATLELREVAADLTDERYRSIVLPTFLLAEYRGDELACVTPHRDGDEVRTVADRLARLARDEAAAFDSLPRATPSGTPPSRPEADPEPIASE